MGSDKVVLRDYPSCCSADIITTTHWLVASSRRRTGTRFATISGGELSRQSLQLALAELTSPAAGPGPSPAAGAGAGAGPREASSRATRGASRRHALGQSTDGPGHECAAPTSAARDRHGSSPAQIRDGNCWSARGAADSPSPEAPQWRVQGSRQTTHQKPPAPPPLLPCPHQSQSRQLHICSSPAASAGQTPARPQSLLLLRHPVHSVAPANRLPPPPLPSQTPSLRLAGNVSAIPRAQQRARSPVVTSPSRPDASMPATLTTPAPVASTTRVARQHSADEKVQSPRGFDDETAPRSAAGRQDGLAESGPLAFSSLPRRPTDAVINRSGSSTGVSPNAPLLPGNQTTGPLARRLSPGAPRPTNPIFIAAGQAAVNRMVRIINRDHSGRPSELNTQLRHSSTLLAPRSTDTALLFFYPITTTPGPRDCPVRI
ncbi:unnamed protein product [Protopolystoma xenopodis]|uniref:Uncharacterized protein n=1 Tax=Protopolystoma xenopodis TaxID=117903 RepID=A0A3S5FCN6_9PLAT|nr:unnamed protein product [Protopolystoma xenopodis]